MLILDQTTGRFVPLQQSIVAAEPPRMLALPAPAATVSPLQLPAIEDRRPADVPAEALPSPQASAETLQPASTEMETVNCDAPAAALDDGQARATVETKVKAESSEEAVPKPEEEKKPKITVSKAVERLQNALETRDGKRGTGSMAMKKPGAAVKNATKKPAAKVAQKKKLLQHPRPPRTIL